MSSPGAVALVADDHELFRAAVADLLKRDCGFTSVIEVGSLDEAMQVLGEHPEISLASFDLAMPGVGNATSLRSVREVFPKVRVVVVTGSGGREDILLALQAGLHGYVPKTLGISEIANAFRTVLAGNIYVPAVVTELPPQPAPPAVAVPARLPELAGKLTPRQQDVLRLIRCGRSNKEIAIALGLTENTVKVHANALYRALGVHNRYGAAHMPDPA
ncbi:MULTISPECIES: LuxR C-terminal-related transcriptional regulator [Methylobacterium]|uniref:LuxR C-terminal-related transcriptional regulator n=1 Tax=Methylobacterium TaxID=407 RepID=UPI00104797BA|nr:MULTISPECIES: response regulator transcription factor [Methylobacterium]MDR7039262.1 DNA-binding NarL/FixJ family response regulator [Methylobacterium sp. BE186]